MKVIMNPRSSTGIQPPRDAVLNLGCGYNVSAGEDLVGPFSSVIRNNLRYVTEIGVNCNDKYYTCLALRL